jgi:predicted outer membrane protein
MIRLALALVLIFTTATAQESESARWTKIHLTALVAIDAGRLAETRAVSPEIRNLGKLTAYDAGELDRRLRELAAKSGITLAGSPKPAQAQFEELRQLQGVEFDRKFLNFNYGAAESLYRQLANVRELSAIFEPIIRDDAQLSGWCLGHCVPRKPQ